VRTSFVFLLLTLPAAPVPSSAQDPILRWGGDAEGGAPFMEASPEDPTKLVGFDVEIAELIARGLGRKPEFVVVQYAQIDQSVARGDVEIGLSGIEDTPARRSAMAVTIPYFQFSEVLSVRDADRETFRTLEDLGGRRVATLGGTIAYEILLRAQSDHDITPVSYDDDVHPYSDLVLGRVDAVLLDNVLAERRKKTISGFTIQPESVATSH
jgi:polar amino acid transport system substrate-binding protein